MSELGHPKYNLNDVVTFEYYGKTLTGSIGIIDTYGTLGQHEEPSYDILVNEGDHGRLYKHVRESWILEERK